MSKWLDRYKATIVIILVIIIIAGGAVLLYKNPWDKGPLAVSYTHLTLPTILLV